MVEVHVLDAWLAPAARGAAWPLGLFAGSWMTPHAVLNMIGGFAAPGFLYMAGLSQALADAAQERKGMAPQARRGLALRRAVWLLGVAYAFRLAEALLGGGWSRPGGWADVLKVDVLNVIAVGLVMAALLSVGRRRALGAASAGIAAIAIVLATPVVAEALRHYDVPQAGAALDLAARAAPNRLVDVLSAYLYASWPRANFHLFNWVAFLLAGSAMAPLALARNRPFTWLGIAAALFGLAWWADRWPAAYAHQDFWRTSHSWFGMVGYIASVELTYGAILEWLSWRVAGGPLRKALSFGATVAGIVAMIAVTWAISLAWERLQALRKARAAAPAVAA